jgi:hypothetical protein
VRERVRVCVRVRVSVSVRESEGAGERCVCECESVSECESECVSVCVLYILTAINAGNSDLSYSTRTTSWQEILKTVSLTRPAYSNTQIQVLPHTRTNLGHQVAVATKFCVVVTTFCKLAPNTCRSSTLFHFTRLLLKLLRRLLDVSAICVTLSQTICSRRCNGAVGTVLNLTG